METTINEHTFDLLALSRGSSAEQGSVINPIGPYWLFP